MCDKPAPENKTREQALEAQTQRIIAAQEQYPDTDLKLDAKWWAAGTDFSFDVKDQLDAETNAKVNAAARRIIEAGFAPDVLKSGMQEIRGLLSAHEGLLKQFEAIFNNFDGLKSADGSAFAGAIQQNQSQTRQDREA